MQCWFPRSGHTEPWSEVAGKTEHLPSIQTVTEWACYLQLHVSAPGCSSDTESAAVFKTKTTHLFCWVQQLFSFLKARRAHVVADTPPLACRTRSGQHGAGTGTGTGTVRGS